MKINILIYTADDNSGPVEYCRAERVQTLDYVVHGVTGTHRPPAAGGLSQLCQRFNLHFVRFCRRSWADITLHSVRQGDAFTLGLIREDYSQDAIRCSSLRNVLRVGFEPA